MTDPATSLPLLLTIAWLLPLASFVVICLAGRRLGKAGVLAGYLATGAIACSCLLSLTAMGIWLCEHGAAAPDRGHDAQHAAVMMDAGKLDAGQLATGVVRGQSGQ